MICGTVDSPPHLSPVCDMRIVNESILSSAPFLMLGPSLAMQLGQACGALAIGVSRNSASTNFKDGNEPGKGCRRGGCVRASFAFRSLLTCC